MMSSARAPLTNANTLFFMRTYFALALLTILPLSLGCGDDSGPITVFPDTGPRVDSGVDGGDDGGADAGDSGFDAGVDSGYDAGTPDAGFDGGPIDVCEGYVAQSCTEDGCDTGFLCVADGCGGTACTPGRVCTSSDDCGGNACVDNGFGMMYCEATTGACISHDQCPEGYRCEGDAGSMSCVDRRVPCGSVTSLQCPQGYVCAFDLSANFCRPAAPPCSTTAECATGSTCADPASTGTSVCMPAGSCIDDSDCTDSAAPVCSIDPAIASTICGTVGFCGGSVSCPTGYDCLDLNDDGSFMCELTGGSCSSDAECPARGVCASPTPDVAPSCLVPLEST